MSDAAPATASRWDDYLDIFVAPKKAFERRTDGRFGHALLVYVVLSALIFFGTRSALEPIMMGEFERGMRQNPNITPEQIEQARGFAGIGGIIFVVAGVPILILIMGAAAWLSAKAIGKKLTYGQGAAIIALSMFPRLIDQVVSAVQALLLDESKLNSRFHVSLGLGRFIDPDTGNQLLLALVGRIDVFTIWITILVGLGIKTMTKSTTGQAAAAAALVWLIGALPALFGALR